MSPTSLSPVYSSTQSDLSGRHCIRTIFIKVTSDVISSGYCFTLVFLDLLETWNTGLHGWSSMTPDSLELPHTLLHNSKSTLNSETLPSTLALNVDVPQVLVHISCLFPFFHLVSTIWLTGMALNTYCMLCICKCMSPLSPTPCVLSSRILISYIPILSNWNCYRHLELLFSKTEL